MKHLNGQHRDPTGDLLTPAHGAVGLARIDDLTYDACRDRQARVEADAILREDLCYCGLTRDEFRVLDLKMAGWTLGEAAVIMGVSRSTTQRAILSIREKVGPLVHP